MPETTILQASVECNFVKFSDVKYIKSGDYLKDGEEKEASAFLEKNGRGFL
jgi:hypothetical protein